MRVGLTGGVGAGKSTVAALLAEQGAVIVDADAIAREVVGRGTPGFEAVVARFGPDVLGADGELDRPRLGRLVFADEAALADLNGIVHPLVRARSAALVAAAPQGAVVVQDIPLLAEGGRRGDFDLVIVVEAPLPLRLARLAERGLPEADARARIARQATDEERRAIADVVLTNGGTRAELATQVEALWARLTGPGLEPDRRIG